MTPRLRKPGLRKLPGLRQSSVALAVAGGLLAATVSTANANLIVEIRVDGGALQTLANTGNDGPASFSYGGPVFTITGGGASSNSPGTSSLSKLLSTTLSVSNITASSHQLEILVGATDFTSPTAPPGLTVDSHIGGSVVGTNLLNTAAFSSCINTSNIQDGCGGPGYIIGPTHPNITTSSFNADAFLSLNSLGGPYSLSEDLLITLGGGSEINYSTNTTLAPVPEPASLSLLSVGLIGLGFLARRRSRKQ